MARLGRRWEGGLGADRERGIPVRSKCSRTPNSVTLAASSRVPSIQKASVGESLGRQRFCALPGCCYSARTAIGTVPGHTPSPLDLFYPQTINFKYFVITHPRITAKLQGSDTIPIQIDQIGPVGQPSLPPSTVFTSYGANLVEDRA